MKLVRAAATVGGFTLISRLTGFARDVLIAATLGAGPVADAFFVAFKLPNFFRRLTAEGALSVAFIPAFATRLETEGKAAALRFASEVQAVAIAALAALLLAAELAMPWIVAVVAPGFLDTPDRFDLTVTLTRITFPYLPLISLVALLGGVLNGLGRFAAMASAPILLNLILIAAMTIFAGRVAAPGPVLAWGVALAGLAQLLWLLEACRRAGALPRWRRPRLTPSVRRLLRVMLPAMAGSGVVQINLLIDVILASTLPVGSISWLYYADRVNQLPLGVIGVAVGTALLPLLARRIGAGDRAGALAAQNRALELAMLLTLPAAAGLALLAGPIIAVLFQRGAFDTAGTAASAAALTAYAAGLPAFVLVKLFQPGFFARGDTSTPVKVAVVAVVLNLVLNLILMRFLAHVGLALATAIAAWFNAAALAWLLRRAGHFALDARNRRRLPRIAAATLAMAAPLWLVRPLLEGGGGLAEAAGLFAAIAAAALLFAAAALLAGAVRMAELRQALARADSGDRRA